MAWALATIGRLGKTLAIDAFLLAWHGARRVFGMNEQRTISESKATRSVPMTAVGILCMDHDQWIVQLYTVIGCTMIGRATDLATLATRIDAEDYIAEHLGEQFDDPCYDGAELHDGYWLG